MSYSSRVSNRLPLDKDLFNRFSVASPSTGDLKFYFIVDCSLFANGNGIKFEETSYAVTTSRVLHSCRSCEIVTDRKSVESRGDNGYKFKQFSFWVKCSYGDFCC